MSTLSNEILKHWRLCHSLFDEFLVLQLIRQSREGQARAAEAIRKAPKTPNRNLTEFREKIVLSGSTASRSCSLAITTYRSS